MDALSREIQRLLKGMFQSNVLLTHRISEMHSVLTHARRASSTDVDALAVASTNLLEATAVARGFADAVAKTLSDHCARQHEGIIDP